MYAIAPFAVNSVLCVCSNAYMFTTRCIAMCLDLKDWHRLVAVTLLQ